MIIDCILSACNLNKLYYDFVPIFVKSWKKLIPEADVKIILISDILPNDLKEYETNIILFKPIQNISSAFISQYIRNLYPAVLNYTNGVLITDIDMLPMNRKYYTNNIKYFDNNKFIHYRAGIYFDDGQMVMCYNVAPSNIWKKIFDVNTENDIVRRLIEVHNKVNYDGIPGHRCWSIDQLDLYEKVMAWDKKTNNLILLDDKINNFHRLDRETIMHETDLIKKIKTEYYSDYHALRPYHLYKEINDVIYDLLPSYQIS